MFLFTFGPPGFPNAPVSKALVVATAVLSLLVSALRCESLLALRVDACVDAPVSCLAGRALASQSFFASAAETFFGVLLLFYWRMFERSSGTPRYAFFVLYVVALTAVLQFAATLGAALLLEDAASAGWSVAAAALAAPAPGPYALVFAGLLLFVRRLPATYRVSVMQRVRVTDKTFVYVIAAQMLVAGGVGALLPAALGVVAGATYDSPTWQLRLRAAPKWLVRLIEGELLADAADEVERNGGGGGGGGGVVRVASPPAPTMPSTVAAPPRAAPLTAPRAAAPTAPAPPAPPSAASVQTLVDMGFDEQAVVQALTVTRNNLEAATNLLLDDSSG